MDIQALFRRIIKAEDSDVSTIIESEGLKISADNLTDMIKLKNDYKQKQRVSLIHSFVTLAIVLLTQFFPVTSRIQAGIFAGITLVALLLMLYRSFDAYKADKKIKTLLKSL